MHFVDGPLEPPLTCGVRFAIASVLNGLQERERAAEPIGRVTIRRGDEVGIGPQQERRVMPESRAAAVFTSTPDVRSAIDPEILRWILRVKDGDGGTYWYVVCGACEAEWQVPYYAAESSG